MKNKKTNLQSITLYNFILPILFFEVWNILLVLIIVILIETIVISKFTKITFSKLFKVVLFANIITTIVGYLFQGIIRMLIFIPISAHYGYTKILNIIGGNLSLDSYASKPGVPYEMLINFSLNMIFAFIISIFFEVKFIRKELNVLY